MLQIVDPANRKRRLIPLRKAPCELPARISYLTSVDFTDPAEMEDAWRKLLTSLGAAPKPIDPAKARRPGAPFAPLPAALAPSLPTIDHRHVMDAFHALLDPGGAVRVLRVLGEAKLGKSHLLTKVLPALAAAAGAGTTVCDLRSPSQGPIDHLLYLRQALYDLAWPRFDPIYADYRQRPQSAGADLNAILAAMAQRGQEEREAARWATPLTQAFVADLRAGGQPRVLVFDSVEQAAGATQAWLMDVLLAQLASAPTVRVAVGGRQLPEAPGSYAACCRSCALHPVVEEKHYVDYCRTVQARSLPEDHIPTLMRALGFSPGAFAEAIVPFIA